jgi:hypothetical protein
MDLHLTSLSSRDTELVLVRVDDDDVDEELVDLTHISLNM